MLQSPKFGFFAFLFAMLASHLVNGQWIQSKSLTGGSIVNDIIEFEGELFLATPHAGIYRHDILTNLWINVNVPAQSNLVSLVQHKTELLAISYEKSYRTTDGVTWTTGTAPAAFIHAVASDGTTLFAGTHLGIYKSSDDGVTWTVANDANVTGSVSAISVDGSNVWAGAEMSGFVYKSIDGGVNWTKLNRGTTKINSIYQRSDGIFLNSEFDGCYKSTDGGQTWGRMRAAANSDGVLLVTAGPLYHYDGTKLATSTNAGSSWVENPESFTDYSVETIGASATQILLGTWGGGVFATAVTGGTTWEPFNNGYSAQEISALAVSGSSIYVGTENSFVRTSTDGGATWMQGINSFGGSAGNGRSLTVSGTDIFVGQGGGGVHRSEDNGATWVAKNQGLPSQIVHGLTARNGVVFVGLDEGVFASNNRGDTWVKKFETPAFQIRTLYADAEKVYVGMFTGLYASANNGETWVKISETLPNQSVSSLATMGNTLFVSTQFEGLQKSTDDGATWDQVYSGLTLSVAVRDANVFVAALGGGLFMSADEGATWTDIGEGLASGTVSHIGFTDDLIIVGKGSGSGIWLREATQLLPPHLTFESSQPNDVFYVGEEITISSGQELRTPAGDKLVTSELESYIEVKTEGGQPAQFTAVISDDARVITLKIDPATNGTQYIITVKDLENASGLVMLDTESQPLMAKVNSKPVLSEISIETDRNKAFTFSSAIFEEAFEDADEETMIKLKVSSLPAHGLLFAGGVLVVINTEIPADELGGLQYRPETGYDGEDEWEWNAFDGHDYSASPSLVKVKVLPILSASNWASEISVFPVPASDRLYISLPAQYANESQISLRNAAGRMVAGANPGNVNTVEIEIGDLAPGMYFLEIVTAAGSSNWKVVK